MYVLDCTLRDGGYYNNWDFPQDVVEAYLNAVAKSGVDYVELGLRSFPKPGFLGAYAYTTEQYLNTLDLPEGPVYGVMVDAKSILSSELDVEEAVDELFVSAGESKIGLVRIAGHFNEVLQSGRIVKRLKALGYQVGFNLMQSGGKSSDLICEVVKEIATWDGLDVLYFADSLGNMDGREVERVIKAIRKNWFGDLGIHTHDNMNRGLDNCIIAKKLGVNWLDSTITGMGRGAGNTQTERLLTVLMQDYSNYNPQPVYDLVIRFFEGLQREYGWGSNLLYFLGARNNVHPTYIQNLLSNKHYGTNEIVGAIGYLSELESTSSYNGSVLDAALNFHFSSGEVSGTKDLIDLFENKEVLILTNAPSTKKYKKAIELYIDIKKPIVLSVNINEYISEDFIDYYVISHNAKFLSDYHQYKKINKKFILPMHRFKESEVEFLKGLTVINFGFQSSSDDFQVFDDYMESPYDLTICYALGIVTVANSAKVSLVGFDGFDKDDIRQSEMLKLFDMYQGTLGYPALTSLTPTSYPIEKGSIYVLA